MCGHQSPSPARVKILTYRIKYDFGFAPNPFMGYCTLATCKPIIRKGANIGDWVIGIASNRHRTHAGKMVYAMEVNEKMTFNQYWSDERFQIKKPVMNGSLQRTYGDNIYFFDENIQQWHQADSRHSLENGEKNLHHLETDTSGKYVLISDNFYYLGGHTAELPDEFKPYFSSTQGQKYIREETIINNILAWIKSNFSPGITGFPIEFQNNKFQRLLKL